MRVTGVGLWHPPGSVFGERRVLAYWLLGLRMRWVGVELALVRVLESGYFEKNRSAAGASHPHVVATVFGVGAR